MINPISSAHVSDAHQVAQPSAPKPTAKPEPPPPTPRTVKSGEVSHDQVTLRSAGDLDHDRDQK